MSKEVFTIAVSLALACISFQVAAQNPPRNYNFANAKMEDWSIIAETQVTWHTDQGQSLPYVEAVNCYGHSEDAELSMDDATSIKLRLRFRGPSEDGDLEEITALGDHLWLYIDGERWEYANIKHPSGALLNVNYPAKNGPEVIIPVWHGFKAVRRSSKEPWLNFNILQAKVLSAKTLAWSFKSRDWTVVDRELNELPKGWQNARYPIDNTRWRAVAQWCAVQVTSDLARTLPSPLLDFVKP